MDIQMVRTTMYIRSDLLVLLKIKAAEDRTSVSKIVSRIMYEKFESKMKKDIKNKLRKLIYT